MRNKCTAAITKVSTAVTTMAKMKITMERSECSEPVRKKIAKDIQAGEKLNNDLLRLTATNKAPVERLQEMHGAFNVFIEQCNSSQALARPYLAKEGKEGTRECSHQDAGPEPQQDALFRCWMNNGH